MDKPVIQAPTSASEEQNKKTLQEPSSLDYNSDSAGNAGEAPSLFKRLRNPRTLISFAFAALLIGFMIWKLDINPRALATQVATASPGFFIAAFLIYYLSYFTRALRWRILLKNAAEQTHELNQVPSTLALTEIIAVSWFANCVIPAKLGDAYRGYALKRDANIPFTRTMGTVLAERLMDMLVLFSMLSIGGLFAFGTNLPPEVLLILSGGLGLSVVIILVLLFMRFANGFMEKIVPRRFLPLYQKFRFGMLQSFNPRTLPYIFSLTVLTWCCEAGRLYFAIRSLGYSEVSFATAIFIALAASLLTTIPATPGGLGLVEGGMIGLLATFVIKNADHNLANNSAVAIVAVDRIISYWFVVLIGLVIYLRAPIFALSYRLSGRIRGKSTINGDH